MEVRAATGFREMEEDFQIDLSFQYVLHCEKMHGIPP